MFREMRRKKQLLSESDSAAILEKGSYGVLSVLGDDGYPYGVPMNYIYEDGVLYFHCAREGHKIDAIRRDPKVSFCVVDSDEVVAEEYTTYFRSVIAFGKAEIVEDAAEKRDIITRLAKRFHPSDSEQHRDALIEREFPPLSILRMKIEHMSGKEAIELVRKRTENV